jgi:hypothetical protein
MISDIILPGAGSAYTSGYNITWWKKCLHFRISYYLVEEVLTLPDIILPGGGSAYPSGYNITWWRNCLPFRISYYLVDEVFLHQVIRHPEG